MKSTIKRKMSLLWSLVLFVLMAPISLIMGGVGFREEELFEDVLKDASGFLTNRQRGASFPLARITEVQNLIYNSTFQGDHLAPHQREYLLREVMTTADFPLLFSDVLQRQMLAGYVATPPVWKQFTKMSTVPRIYPQVGGSRFAMAGGDGELDLIPEKGEYPASTRTETRYQIYVRKYGRQYDISWEALVNDDLNALKDTPMRFAKAALRTEHRIATGLYYHNSVLATAGRGNLTVNLLTQPNLQTALQWFAARTDPGGNSIAGRATWLVVPPALELTARTIITSTHMAWTDDSTGTLTPSPTVNVIPQMGLKLVVDPYITILGASANPLSSIASWFLFTDPGELAVLEAAHLTGHERPEIAMKASNKVTIGGGSSNPMSGDFETDNVFYRVRTVFGGITLDWRGFYFGGHLD